MSIKRAAYKLFFPLLCLTCGAVCLIQARASTTSQSQSAKTWAVVIGISKYAKLGGGQQLKFADSDATAFAEVLKKSGATSETVRLLVNQNATAAAIKDAIGNWLARAPAEEDTVCIYFSGHGFVEKGFNEAYLLAHDSDLNAPYSTAVSLTELSYALSRRIKARRVLVIGDAVREDFFKSDDEEKANSVTFSKTFIQLSEWRAGISVMLANGEGEYSREGERWGRQGVFTRHLIDAISGGADDNRDGLTNADEAFYFLASRVAKDTSDKQNPKRSGATMAQVVLANRGSVLASAPQRAEPVATKVETPAPVQTTTSTTGTANPPETQPPASTRREIASINNTTVQPKSNAAATSPVNNPAVNNPPASNPTGTTPTTNQPPAKPATNKSVTTEPATSTASAATKTENKPAPPPNLPAPNPPTPPTISKTATPPTVATVSAPIKTAPTTQPLNSSVPVSTATAPPSPLVFDFEAALKDGRLIEPRGANAWDIYQQMAQQPANAADVARFKPQLADALIRAGRAIVVGDLRGDNITDRVEEFRRAGQMLTRARTLAGANQEIDVLEKLSAAQALIALQFYDEAERALSQLPRSAATENSLGLVYTGKLDYWKAERALKSAIELDAAAAMPHYNLGLLYRLQKNEAALAEFESAAKLNTNNYALHLAVGDEYFSRSQWQPAAEAYRKAVALKPLDDTLHTKLGHALYSQGLRDEANKSYQKAKELRSRQ